MTHTEEYAQAIQEKKSLTKTLLDTGVSLKRDIDTYASEHKWAGYAKSGLEWLLKGVGYGVTVCAVSTVGAKFGTVAAIATAGGLVISGEATAEIINRGGEQLVDYAVSFADTPEEAAGYADVVISGLETIVTVAGAVGGYKAGKAMVGKLANLKARVPAKVEEAFGGKVAVNKTSIVEPSLTNVIVANVNQALEAGKVVGASTKKLSECNTVEFAIKMAEHQHKKSPAIKAVDGTKSHKAAKDLTTRMLRKYGEELNLNSENIRAEEKCFLGQFASDGAAIPKSGYSKYDLVNIEEGVIVDYKFFSRDRPNERLFDHNRLQRMIQNAPKKVTKIYGIRPVFNGTINTGKFEAVKVLERK